MAIGRLLVIAGAMGCHAGAGPVVAFTSNGGVRLGADASAGVGPIAASVGGTAAVTSDEPQRFYVTVDPGVGLPLTDRSGDAYEVLGTVGFSAGYSTNAGYGDHLALGVWGAPVLVKGPCDDAAPAYSIAIGLRTLGDLTELFIAPKINYAELICVD